MKDINLGVYKEEMTIHFGSQFSKINAYTLASTLVAISDSIKTANSIVNPGYDVEVIVEALGSGSFRAKIKAVYCKAGNIFSAENLKSIVLSIIATYIWQNSFAPDNNVNVIVNTDEVIIEQQDKRVIIPREVHDGLKSVEKSEVFKSNVTRLIASIENDQNIDSFGFTKEIIDKEPDINIPKSDFVNISKEPQIEGNTREIIEATEITITRSILERTRRRWEFVWHGIRIPAPVLDDKFYSDFFAHKITIAPGDSLRARLKITQIKDPETDIYTNSKYEVIEVLEHIPRPDQTRVELD